MTDRKTAAGDGAQAAIKDVSSAYAKAKAVIAAIPDGQEAFERATELYDLLRKLHEEAAGFRAQMVHRIWETEKLSLAGLANRISVSRARAGQLLDSAKKAREDEDPEQRNGGA